MYGTFYNTDTAALSLATFFDTIDRKFFTPNFGTYEHMTFFNDPTAFKIIVLGIYIGLIIASLFTFYNRRVLGGFVRKLDSEGALAPENAKTLDELGYGKNFFVKQSLRRGYSLRKVINYVPDDDSRSGGNLARAAAIREKVDFDKDSFYLPEEKRDLTVQRFRAQGSGVLSIVLLAVLGLIAAVLILKLSPFVVNIFESIAEGFSNDPDVLR